MSLLPQGFCCYAVHVRFFCKQILTLVGSPRQLNPNDAVATLTAADVALVQAQIGTIASVVHGVRDKRDRTCNGGVCDIATRGFTCDQAIVNAANPKWCMVRAHAAQLSFDCFA